jgi:hypothetical protein
MILRGGQWGWDIRIHPSIIHWRAECLRLRIPYYWKLNVDEAQDLCDLLASSYGIHPPVVFAFNKHPAGPRVNAAGELRGCYLPYNNVILIHARAHVKTVVHEFYHHLDHVTNGMYDSDDHPDGSRGHTTSVSFGWQFADRFWAALTGVKEKRR